MIPINSAVANVTMFDMSENERSIRAAVIVLIEHYKMYGFRADVRGPHVTVIRGMRAETVRTLGDAITFIALNI